MGYDNIEKVTNIYKIAKKRFFERNLVFKYFKNINEARKDEIKNNANVWLENCTKNSTVRIALSLFSNLNDRRINIRENNRGRHGNELFDFIDNDEELMFYMFVIDPELKLLQINYEENETKNVKRRYFEEFGIELDIRLLSIELAYNKKFPTIVDEFEMSLKRN